MFILIDVFTNIWVYNLLMTQVTFCLGPSAVLAQPGSKTSLIRLIA